MNRILLYPHERDNWTTGIGNTITLPRHDFRVQHILQILKPSLGEVLQAGIINESKGILRVLNILDDSMEMKYIAEFEEGPFLNSSRFSLNIHLLLAHFRPPVMSRIIKDLTSMGVSSINIFISELTEKNYMQSTMWHNSDELLLLGAMQGDTYLLPTLNVSYSLKDAVEKLDIQFTSDVHTIRHKIICDQHASRTLLGYLSQIYDQKQKNVRKCDITIAIGPERGFTQLETEACYNYGFVGVSLGRYILRSEVATMLCAGILQMN